MLHLLLSSLLLKGPCLPVGLLSQILTNLTSDEWYVTSHCLWLWSLRTTKTKLSKSCWQDQDQGRDQKRPPHNANPAFTFRHLVDPLLIVSRQKQMPRCGRHSRPLVSCCALQGQQKPIRGINKSFASTYRPMAALFCAGWLSEARRRSRTYKWTPSI